MGFVVKFLKWIWRGFEIFAPIAPLLWGVTVYSGIAFSVYVAISQTASLVGQLSSVFAGWADNIDQSILAFFNNVSSSSVFQFFAYILSLDVPIDWFRRCSDSFIRYWLTYTCGVVLAVIEICIVVLGIYFLRSRMKKVSEGLLGDRTSS